MKTVKSTIAHFLLIAACGLSSSQVIIGDAVGTASVKTSVLLEFANQCNKGLIVPYNRTLPATTEGSIILDATNASTARVRFYNGTEWKDLSEQDANVVAELSNQPTIAEGADAKIIIGNSDTAPDGALVLESNTQALILPHVSDYKNILNPSPGMLV